ncbi:hypothetical protein [Treponema sp.]|uniref:hypothetical protein n=1 Tax=Treponema sp. TaxID=166 RepID=UPI00388D6FEC
MYLKCRECGRTFRSNEKWTMCPECIADEMVGKKEQQVPKPKKKKTISQLERDAKRASELGMSYGQYVAELRAGRIV